MRLRSSPPLETKFNAIKMFDSLPSSICSSERTRVAVPHPFCSLALRVAAPRKATAIIDEVDYTVTDVGQS